jgi:hypothetical protein
MKRSIFETKAINKILELVGVKVGKPVFLSEQQRQGDNSCIIATQNIKGEYLSIFFVGVEGDSVKVQEIKEENVNQHLGPEGKELLKKSFK